MIEFYIWKATISGHLPIPTDSDPKALSYADNQNEEGARTEETSDIANDEISRPLSSRQGAFLFIVARFSTPHNSRTSHS